MESPPEVLAAPVFNWTGGYIGGQIGYLWGSGEATADLGLPFDGSADVNPDGWLGGVYFGYNYQMTNNVVLGVDGDFAWTGADDSSTVVSNGVNVGSLDTELDWEGAVRLRLGYAVDRFLPYIAGGVAFGRLHGTGYDTGGVYQGEASETNTGWTIGVGTEYAFTDNLVGRAEYRYTDLGSFDANVNGTPISADLSTNDVRFGLAWKF
ncbi:MAG: porin family protein, partial [Hyphomicrobiales bacterium]|nr:porin family protein [Hyphomicrobiales bacterium]